MAFWHDLAHGVLHFEGKIWRTLPLLAWRPSALTRRYIDGERARFVSPMALFLFSVFLMFAIFSAVGGPFDSASNVQASAEAARDLQREVAGLDARISGSRRRSARWPPRRTGSGGRGPARRAAPPSARRSSSRSTFAGRGAPGANGPGRRVTGWFRPQHPDALAVVQSGGRAHPGESDALRLQAAEQRLQIFLGADSDLGAVRLAALCLAPPVQGL